MTDLYITRPKIVKAMQLTVGYTNDPLAWAAKALEFEENFIEYFSIKPGDTYYRWKNNTFLIYTNTETLVFYKDYWIVRHVDGKFLRYTNDEFHNSFEKKV